VSGARDLGAARGQLVFATAPFIGALVAWVVLSDPVSGRELVAFAFGLIGVSFVLRSHHEHTHAHGEMVHDHDHEHDVHHQHEHDGHRPDEPIPSHHSHPHRHEPLVHRHPHVPDLHHRHEHH
jgi:hypothetical protein